MNEQQKISQNEIDKLKNHTGSRIECREDYPHCVIIKEIELPSGWSKRNTDIMLIKQVQGWKIFIDGDVTSTPKNIEHLLSMYSDNGWCEIKTDGAKLDTVDSVNAFIANTLSIDLNINKQSEGNTNGVIGNIFVYKNNDILQFTYQYLGPNCVVGHEVYDMNNNMVRNLGVKEIEEGWMFEDWDLKDNNNQTVADGFYVLKLRSSQSAGEINKCELICKAS